MIYQKTNGTLIYRTSKTKPTYNIGQTTSMGWLVIDIKKLYKGKLLSFSEYDSVIMKHLEKKPTLFHLDMNRVIEIVLISLVFYTLIVK